MSQLSDEPKTKITYTAYFDGACTSNPGGIASYGAVVFQDTMPLWQCSEIYSPPEGREHETTNNVAEYLGLLAVLNYFLESGLRESAITVYGDSDLVIQQCFGTWKVEKKGRLYEALAFEAKDKLRLFGSITGRWIPREQNALADKLSKLNLPKAAAGKVLKQEMTLSKQSANTEEAAVVYNEPKRLSESTISNILESHAFATPAKAATAKDKAESFLRWRRTQPTFPRLRE